MNPDEALVRIAELTAKLDAANKKAAHEASLKELWAEHYDKVAMLARKERKRCESIIVWRDHLAKTLREACSWLRQCDAHGAKAFADRLDILSTTPPESARSK
jgi:hypothetical protein